MQLALRPEYDPASPHSVTSVNHVPPSSSPLPTASGRSQTRARWLLAGISLGIVGLAFLVWRFTPLAQWASAQQLAGLIGNLRDAWWAPVAIIALYIIGGLIVFPITLLIAATAVVFDPLLAATLSFAGVLANAVATYLIGARLVRGMMLAAFGPTVRHLSAVLADRGVIAIAIIRMLPIAPFTLINIAAGSIGVRWRDYVIGTALGIAPGIIALTVFGRRLREVISHPTFTNIAILVAAVIGWIGLSLLLQSVLTRRNTKR
jgi:uncharacterized membrane protein YdjX (TVP38/TMEM64 family)